jgi:hypothetical protein
LMILPISAEDSNRWASATSDEEAAISEPDIGGAAASDDGVEEPTEGVPPPSALIVPTGVAPPLEPFGLLSSNIFSTWFLRITSSFLIS